MKAEELALQLWNVLPNVGVTPPIDVVGFDAPLMMGQEVAFAFRDVATTFIATADLDLGPGWDWTGTLTRLAADPFVSAAGFATAEVQAWDAHHAGPADVLGRAHAALDLTRAAEYAGAWSALSSAMLTSAPDWLAIARMQFATAPGYGIDEAPAHDPKPALRDAGQLLDALSSDPAFADAAIEARAALDALVLGNAVGDIRRTRSQAAVHLEAPLGGRPFDPASPYTALEWDATTRWSVVLESISNNDDGQPPEFDRVPENTSAPTCRTRPRSRDFLRTGRRGGAAGARRGGERGPTGWSRRGASSRTERARSCGTATSPRSVTGRPRPRRSWSRGSVGRSAPCSSFG
jgi:hypothetical protein